MARTSKDPLGCYNFHIEFRPRFSDLDAFGHVNNARFLTYFEEARVAYLSALQIFIPPASPVTIVINKAQCEYLAPVLHHHQVRVCVRTLDWRRKSFRFEYTVWLPRGGSAGRQGHHLGGGL